ncbi:MAG TPA: hypothetical protein VFQ79_14670 [Bryobacteraceae bacterium]|nr:hypothetical protein [Bryobacteraceae bacterium]
MDGFGQFLFGYVPWLRPVVAWILAALIVFLLLTLPSYFILLPFARRIRTEIATYLSKLAARHEKASAARDEKLDRITGSLCEQRDPRQLNARNQFLYLRCLQRMQGALAPLRKSLDKTTAKLARAAKTVERVPERLRDAQPAQVASVELPAAGELQASVARVRAARTRLVITSVLLLSLVLVNTGMLSQIIRDLGFIPPSLVFLDIPLYVLFALFLTLLEAGLGYIHAATGGDPDDTDRVHLWPYVAIVLAVAIASVEGFFYSQVAPSRDSMVEFPFIGYEIKQAHLFFVWGFALVMVLFGLGSVWSNALDTVRRGNALTELRSRLKKTRKEAERSAKAAAGAVEATTNVTELSHRIGALIGAEANRTTTLRGEVARLDAQLETMHREPPEWADMTERPLTRADVQQLAAQSAMWTALLLLAGLILTFTGFESVTGLNPGIPHALCWAIALGQVLVFTGTGFLLGAGATVVQGTGNERVVLAGPRWSRALAITLAALLTVTYIAVAFLVPMARYREALWICNLLLGYFLIAAGYQLAPLLGVSRLWLGRLAAAVANTLQALHAFIVRILLMISAVLENLFFLLASPVATVIELLRGDQRTTEPPPEPLVHRQAAPR